MRISTDISGRSIGWIHIVMAFGAVGAGALPASSQTGGGPRTWLAVAPESNGWSSRSNDHDVWHLQLTPYFWASGLTGEIVIDNREADVDIGFKEILDRLDGALMLAGSARRGPWGGAFEVLYVNLSDHTGTPGPLFSSATVSFRQLIFESTGRFRMPDMESVAVDLLAGVRYWRLTSSLDLAPGAVEGVSLSGRKSWIDPILGLTAMTDVSSRWAVRARGDVGGFTVGSEVTWQLLGILGYRINDNWSVEAGYRHLDVDYTDGRFAYDVGLAGFIAGFTYAFRGSSR